MGMVKKFDYAHVAEGIARQAGALLRGFYAKGVATEYKGDVDLVTEADRASEKLIVEKLKAAFPTHGVYGEEGTRSELESEYRWYVDPLDGTTNFAHGFPAFCVILGLEKRAKGLAAGGDGGLGGGGGLDAPWRGWSTIRCGTRCFRWRRAGGPG